MTASDLRFSCGTLTCGIGPSACFQGGLALGFSPAYPLIRLLCHLPRLHSVLCLLAALSCRILSKATLHLPTWTGHSLQFGGHHCHEGLRPHVEAQGTVPPVVAPRRNQCWNRPSYGLDVLAEGLREMLDCFLRSLLLMSSLHLSVFLHVPSSCKEGCTSAILG